jgi:hypothetical protein
MKCSLIALLSSPQASVNWRTAWSYFLVLSPSINFLPHRFRKRFAAVEHVIAATRGRWIGTFWPITTQLPRSLPHRLAVLSACGWLSSPTNSRTSSRIIRSINCRPA